MFPRLPAVVGVLAVIVLAACTGPAEPGPGPSGAPTSVGTPSPSPSRGAKQAQEAIEAYRAYEQMLGDTARAGGYDPAAGDPIPESVVATTAGQERDYVNGSNQQLNREGERLAVGGSKIVRVVVASASAQRVDLYTCVDRSSVRYRGKDGERPAPEAYLEKWPTLTLDREEPAGWKVFTMRSRGAKSC